MAEGQLSRCREPRSAAPGGNRRRESCPVAQASGIPPGKYTVILEPAAVLDIVGFMFWDFGGLAILDQRSFLNDRIGTKLFGENINIWDDVAHPLQSGAPFDGEGVRRASVSTGREWRGQASGLCAQPPRRRCANQNTRTRSVEIAVTGHGFPLPNEMGEAPMNIVFVTPGGRADGGTDDRRNRTRRSGHAALVHPRSRSLRKDSHRHDPRRHISTSRTARSRPGSAISASIRA